MFVVYHKQSTRFLRVLRNGYWQDAIYKSQGGATRALNRALAKGEIKYADFYDWGILPMDEFAQLEKKVEKRNLLSGQAFVDSVNTPACCDPSTETYWSL